MSMSEDTTVPGSSANGTRRPSRSASSSCDVGRGPALGHLDAARGWPRSAACRRRSGRRRPTRWWTGRPGWPTLRTYPVRMTNTATATSTLRTMRMTPRRCRGFTRSFRRGIGVAGREVVVEVAGVRARGGDRVGAARRRRSARRDLRPDRRAGQLPAWRAGDRAPVRVRQNAQTVPAADSPQPGHGAPRGRSRRATSVGSRASWSCSRRPKTLSQEPGQGHGAHRRRGRAST